MKKLSNALFAAILAMSSSVAHANERSPWEIEVDPIAYLFSGYSVHVGKVHDSFKFDVGFPGESFTASQTELLLNNTGFTTRFRSVGAKIDYIGSTGTGWHAGIQWDSTDWNYTSVNTGQTASNNIQSIGPRIGYRIGRGNFYIDPWIAFLTNISGTSDVNVGGQIYHPDKFLIFPTVHLGFRF